jgi:hypothetical protein
LNNANAKLDEIIAGIANAYLAEQGWADVIEDLPILEQAQPRVSNTREFTGMEWVGAHWNLAEWCSKAGQHYCGDCKQSVCGEKEQMDIFDFVGREEENE